MNGNVDEIQLWQALLDGNRESLDKLFRLYYESLLNYGLSLVPRRDAVKDAIQDLFLKLWRNRDSLGRPSEGALKSYLFVSLRRVLLAGIKSEQAREERNRSYERSNGSSNGTGTTIEEKIITKEVRSRRKQLLAEAIRKLSPRQREALHLRFRDGFTNREVAEVMDITHQSARNLISEAIRSLKAYAASLPSLYSQPDIPAPSHTPANGKAHEQAEAV